MPTLVDSFQRRIEYVRLSVTDRCDLRCSYCLPKGFKGFAEPDHWLRFDEIERVMAAFARLGVGRIRLTGGEPLLRHDLPDLAARLARLPGVNDLSLSTNATQLAKHAHALYAAGVRRLNISLDTLDPDRFAAITQGGRLDKVLQGIAAAKAAGFAPIKINTVVMRDTNEADIDALVEFCAANGFTLRLIETMPIGDTGRAASERFVDLQAVKERLARKFPLVPSVMPGGGPARYFRLGDSDTNIGFITPISQHFCETCNRVRLSVDGTLYLCLGQSHSLALRPLLREGVDDAALEAAIAHAVLNKPERHEFREKPHKIVRFMALTGG